MTNHKYDGFGNEVLYGLTTDCVGMSTITVAVDFNDMIDRFSETEVWRLLAKLKDVMA